MHCSRQPGNLDRSTVRHPTSYQLDQRILDSRNRFVDFGRARLELRRREDKRKRPGSLRRHPERRAIHHCTSRAVLSEKLTEKITPTCDDGCSSRWNEVFGQADKYLENFVQFVCITHIRPGFFTYLRDRSGIKSADFRENGLRQRAAQGDGPRAALFERSVVEVRIGIG